MNNETREFINRHLCKANYKDYSSFVDANLKEKYPIEICEVNGKTIYPFRDLKGKCTGYINEDGDVEGYINTLFGLSNICYSNILIGSELILTKNFKDTLFLLNNEFNAAGIVFDNISNEQYDILTRLIGLQTIIILLNPSIKNKILTFKAIKKLYPLFNLRVCKLNTSIENYSKEELDDIISNSQTVMRKHYLNADRYISQLKCEVQEIGIEPPNFKEI